MLSEAFLVDAEIMTIDIEVALVLSRGAIAARTFVLVAQNKAYVIRRVPRNHRSYHPCVVLSESLARVEILKPAVIRISVRAYLHADGLANRASDCAHVIAVKALPPSFKRSADRYLKNVSRFFRVNQYGAPCDIPPEKRSLWSPQHLYAFKIEGIKQNGGYLP